MSLFGSSSESVLGVDIGTSSIKLVELRKKQNKVALVTYGFSDRLAPSYPDANKLDIKYVTHTIENILRKSNVSSRQVVASLPTFTVFSSIINLSGNLTDKDMDSSIRWEAKKVIPLPLQDIVLDWQRLDDQGRRKEPVLKIKKKKKDKGAEDKNKSVPAAKPYVPKAQTNKILLIGAPKNLIKSYAFTFKSLKLSLVSLETEIFGLIRSLVGNDMSTVMIVQMGASSTNIFIVSKGVPLLSRSIDVGGLAITKAIAKKLNISLEKAEQFKLDLASKGDKKLPEMVTDTIAPVFNEVKYILEVYASKENQNVERIILTGGSAMLSGLSEFIAEAANKNVVVGDPWFRVAYPADLKPVLEQLGPRLSAAIGLSMRQFDSQ